MNLTELLLNRFLYKTPQQNLETKDAVYDSSNVVPEAVPAIASGGAAQDINIGNVTINGQQLTPGTYPVTVLDVSNWGWGQTCAFSSSTINTVIWGAGNFISADGTTYAISAGTTGVMAAKTYIYLDLLTSITAYQITTTPGTAVGVGKVLVAVAQNSSVVGTLATWNLNQASQIIGDNILANTINASKITTGQLIVGTNVVLGTAQDSAGVTTIIGNTVTTGYVNALSVVAGSVAAENITGTYITGKIVRTSSTGARVQLNGSNNHIEYLYNTSVYGSMFVQAYSQGNGIRVESSSSGAELELIEGSTINYAYLGFNGAGLTITSGGNGVFDGTVSATNLSGTNTGNETAASILAITGGISGTTTLNVRRVTTGGVDSGWYALTYYNGVLTNAVVH